MKDFDPSIFEYLDTQRIGVLSVEMMDGSPHGATVHFAYQKDPLQFLFETNKEYRKAEALFGRETTRASFVIGVDEGNLKTLQMDGVVRLRKPEEQASFDEIYLGKFPNKKEKAAAPNAVFFTIKPTWWRFTDWTRPGGKVILLSE